MNTAKKTTSRPLTGLLILLTTLALSFNIASAGIPIGSSLLPISVSEQEYNDLLAFSNVDEDVKIENIKIKIYGNDDDLVYSANVCHSAYNCDDRLNQLINQSDFITEVDNTRIYILNQ